MRMRWWLVVMLAVLLAASAAATVASRQWMRETFRELDQARTSVRQLLVKEELLQVERVSRTDLNLVESRVRGELGMQLPRAGQWIKVEP